MKVSGLVLVVALLSLAVLAMSRKPMATRYDKFKVYKAFIKDNKQLEEFKKLHQYMEVRLHPTSNESSSITFRLY